MKCHGTADDSVSNLNKIFIDKQSRLLLLHTIIFGLSCFFNFRRNETRRKQNKDEIEETD